MAAAWVPLFVHLGRHPELLERTDNQPLIAVQRWRPMIGEVSYDAAGVLG
jgi:hypothetical protein